jgi:hypothetical protein
MRSDASEEPPQHGRATRNAGRGTTNGRPPKHTLDSDDEEDATSWDGGDEDEEEPEQMELDDDEDELAEDSSEEEDEQQSLVVTLRYGKGSSKPSNGDSTTNEEMPAAAPTNGVKHEPPQPIEMTLGSTSAPPQPEQIPAAMEPSIQPAPPAHPVAPFAHDQPPPAASMPNGVSALQQQPPPAPVMPAAELPQPVGHPAVLPKLDGMLVTPQAIPQPVPHVNGQPTFQPQQQEALKPTMAPGAPAPAANRQ